MFMVSGSELGSITLVLKLQGLGRSMQELWNLMETPIDEWRRFVHCSSLLSSPPDDALKKGCLGLDIIRESNLLAVGRR
ncbi:unnamed protein product [Arabidopsis halleri]